MLTQEIIRAKRDGKVLQPAALHTFIRGLTAGEVSEGQASAFAMAVFFKGLNAVECAELTRAMANSGDTLKWDSLKTKGPVLDKHSTGGIGDNVSLILAPMLAACGAYVPMISGRGLGHTGGTLDKLESIPGYNATPGIDLFKQTVEEVGCAIIGQTENLAPADKRLYAIRDVTATVESVPLITASILSKKLAAGLQALVMDVKVGSGAFMADVASARALAKSIVSVAKQAGLATRTLITDMNEPLASAAGNALEVQNAVDVLTSADARAKETRLVNVTLALGAELLCLGKLAQTPEEAREKLIYALETGAAATKFGQMVAHLGGPADFLTRAQHYLPVADVILPVHAPKSGFVRAIDARAIGLAVIELGGGRKRPDDTIDQAVGFSQLAGMTEEITEDRPLGLVHARTANEAYHAAQALIAAYQLQATAMKAPKSLIYEVIG